MNKHSEINIRSFVAFSYFYVIKHLKRGFALIIHIFEFVIYQLEKINRFLIFRLMWQRGKLGRPLGHLGIVIVSLMIVFSGSFLKTSNVFSDTSLASILREDQSETVNKDFLINLSQVSTQIPEGRSTEEIKTYIVKEGDTLSQIAQDFNVTVDTLIAVNGIGTNDFLYTGQELKILPVSGIEHVVTEGDTVESIAQKYKLDNPQPIIEINWLEKPYTLKVGEKLIVPGGVIPEPPKPTNVAVAITSELTIVPEAPIAGTGQFLWPTPGYSSRGYGWFYGYFHGAIDIANNGCGNPIYASDSGYVEAAGWRDGGWGYTVWIDHQNGFKSRYAHMSSIAISEGINVSRGQLIGYTGETGLAYGCHLHFVIEQNGIAINPQSVL